MRFNAYRTYLADYVLPLTKRALSVNSRIANPRVLRRFMGWLAEQPGYRPKIARSMAEAFSPSTRGKRSARAGRRKYPPTIEQLDYHAAPAPDRDFPPAA